MRREEWVAKCKEYDIALLLGNCEQVEDVVGREEWVADGERRYIKCKAYGIA